MTVVAAASALALQGCSTAPQRQPQPRPVAPVTTPSATPGGAASPAGAAPTAPAAPAAPHDAALMVERQWLQSWFKGTPVRISQQGNGPVTIDVPQEFCFESGRSNVKPALAAVLDKLAQSLRRTPTARLPLLAAPADVPAAPATPPLALQRATQMRTHLLSRGVRAAQLGPPTATAMAAAQLRLDLATP